MRTIAIATHKGGTGKTVSAMAIAAAFARDGIATVLVDLDPQGHSTLGLGVEIAPGQPTLRDLIVEPPRPLHEILVATAIAAPPATPTYDHGRGDGPLTPCAICQRVATRPPLRVLPADLTAERDAQLLAIRLNRERVLRKALARLQPAPEIVVIDCPPSLGPLTENGIAAADLVLAPCQMEARSYSAVGDLLQLIAAVKQPSDDDPPFENWRIVYTRYDARKSATNRMITAALEAYADHTLTTRIPQSEALNQAQIDQVDVFTYAPASKGAAAYLELARELRPLLELPAAAEAWS